MIRGELLRLLLVLLIDGDEAALYGVQFWATEVQMKPCHDAEGE